MRSAQTDGIQIPARYMRYPTSPPTLDALNRPYLKWKLDGPLLLDPEFGHCRPDLSSSGLSTQWLQGGRVARGRFVPDQSVAGMTVPLAFRSQLADMLQAGPAIRRTPFASNELAINAARQLLWYSHCQVALGSTGRPVF